jgi:endonuclease/exonuclease/phosphatase (EEP) superfamily protein YafD
MKQPSRSVRLLASIGVAGFGLVTAAGGLGGFYWFAELLTHFRVQGSLAGLLLVALCGWMGMPRRSLLAAGLTAVHLTALAPYLATESAPTAGAAASVRLMQVNVLTSNRRHREVLDLVRAEQPDILALLEVNERWLDALSPLHGRYPHRISRPQDDNFGIALFSRFPLDELKLRRLGHDRVQMITGRFSLGGIPVALAVVHMLPPATPGGAAVRNAQLDEVAGWVRTRDREVILLGDLNTSPWSPVYRRFEASSGLHNASHGFGLTGTWPAGFRPLRIPLDHYLLSDGLRTVSFGVGPRVGSDHLPVFAEVAAQGAPGDSPR